MVIGQWFVEDFDCPRCDCPLGHLCGHKGPDGGGILGKISRGLPLFEGELGAALRQEGWSNSTRLDCSWKIKARGKIKIDSLGFL